jgi:hypothetical protein
MRDDDRQRIQSRIESCRAAQDSATEMLEWLDSFEVVHSVRETDVSGQFATAERELAEKLKRLICSYEQLLAHAE